jgi:site-specific DNA-cytosine methylase
VLEKSGSDSKYISQKGIMFDSSISEASRSLVNFIGDEIRITQATKQGYIIAKSGDGINLSFPTSKSRRGRVIKQKSSTLDCACNVCVLQGKTIRRFTAKELERLQTLPEGYTEGFPITVVQKAIGNGWTVDVIAHIFSCIKGA